jgi:hypothetical protein
MGIKKNCMINNKHIESYFVRKHPSGMYSLLINTVDRWVNFHAYNDYHFKIGADKINEENELLIPDFLPKGESFVRTVIQNKDQIQFYYIPFSMVRPNEMVYSDTIVK